MECRAAALSAKGKVELRSSLLWGSDMHAFSCISHSGPFMARIQFTTSDVSRREENFPKGKCAREFSHFLFSCCCFSNILGRLVGKLTKIIIVCLQLHSTLELCWLPPRNSREARLCRWIFSFANYFSVRLGNIRKRRRI